MTVKIRLLFTLSSRGGRRPERVSFIVKVVGMMGLKEGSKMEKMTINLENMTYGDGHPLPYGCIKTMLHLNGRLVGTIGGGAYWNYDANVWEKHVSAAQFSPRIDAWALGARMEVFRDRGRGDTAYEAGVLEVGMWRGYLGRDIRVVIIADKVFSLRPLRAALMGEAETSVTGEVIRQGGLTATRISPNIHRLKWIRDDYLTKIPGKLEYLREEVKWVLDPKGWDQFTFADHLVCEAKVLLGYDHKRVILAHRGGASITSMNHLKVPLYLPSGYWLLEHV